jgi:quinohemoprotein ethanol dehydrogenase
VGSLGPDRRLKFLSAIIAFKLNGGAVPTPARRRLAAFEKPPDQIGAGASIAAGELKFVQECSRCHVFGLDTTPDLRRLNGGLHAAFKDIVLRGAFASAAWSGSMTS